MIRSGTYNRSSWISRSALGVALALGVVASGSMVSSPAYAAKKPKPPKMNFSEGFVAVAGPAQKAIDAAKGSADVKAATAQLDAAVQSQNKQQVDAARAAVDSAIAEEKGLLEQAFAAIENEDDRYLAGTLAVNLGSIAGDPALQRKGIKAMLTSGKADAATVPRYNSIAGQLAYQAGDYAEAHRYLQQAVDGGFTDNNAEVILAESYIGDNQSAKGLGILKNAIVTGKSSGALVPESWYRRGLVSAFKAKSFDETAEFGKMLIRDYPRAENVGISATVVRELGNYSSQEVLDLMRLMGRTKSFAEQRDYVEYIQAADPRRLPGEVLDVVNAGLASGMLKPSDTFVADAKTQASSRITGDKASLDGFTRDARKSSASVATVTGAADALLSYGKAAEAEELFSSALSKPGVDTAMVLTRLGIAQVDQGKYAAAQETLSKVTGKRKAIAGLWSAYAASKAAPAVVAVPATK